MKCNGRTDSQCPLSQKQKDISIHIRNDIACIWNLTCQTFTFCSSLVIVGLQLWLTDCWHLLSQAMGKKDSYRRASTSQVPSSGAQTQIVMAICQPVSIHIGNQVTLQHLHLTFDIWSDLTCQTFTFCASALYWIVITVVERTATLIDC